MADLNYGISNLSQSFSDSQKDQICTNVGAVRDLPKGYMAKVYAQVTRTDSPASDDIWLCQGTLKEMEGMRFRVYFEFGAYSVMQPWLKFYCDYEIKGLGHIVRKEFVQTVGKRRYGDAIIAGKTLKLTSTSYDGEALLSVMDKTVSERMYNSTAVSVLSKVRYTVVPLLSPVFTPALHPDTEPPSCQGEPEPISDFRNLTWHTATGKSSELAKTITGTTSYDAYDDGPVESTIYANIANAQHADSSAALDAEVGFTKTTSLSAQGGIDSLTVTTPTKDRTITSVTVSDIRAASIPCHWTTECHANEYLRFKVLRRDNSMPTDNQYIHIVSGAGEFHISYAFPSETQMWARCTVNLTDDEKPDIKICYMHDTAEVSEPVVLQSIPNSNYSPSSKYYSTYIYVYLGIDYILPCEISTGSCMSGAVCRNPPTFAGTYTTLPSGAKLSDTTLVVVPSVDITSFPGSGGTMIGSELKPIYINGNGKVAACDPTNMTVGYSNKSYIGSSPTRQYLTGTSTFSVAGRATYQSLCAGLYPYMESGYLFDYAGQVYSGNIARESKTSTMTLIGFDGTYDGPKHYPLTTTNNQLKFKKCESPSGTEGGWTSLVIGDDSAGSNNCGSYGELCLWDRQLGADRKSLKICTEMRMDNKVDALFLMGGKSGGDVLVPYANYRSYYSNGCGSHRPIALGTKGELLPIRPVKMHIGIDPSKIGNIARTSTSYVNVPFKDIWDSASIRIGPKGSYTTPEVSSTDLFNTNAGGYYRYQINANLLFSSNNTNAFTVVGDWLFKLGGSQVCGVLQFNNGYASCSVSSTCSLGKGTSNVTEDGVTWYMASEPVLQLRAPSQLNWLGASSSTTIKIISGLVDVVRVGC